MSWKWALVQKFIIHAACLYPAQQNWLSDLTSEKAKISTSTRTHEALYYWTAFGTATGSESPMEEAGYLVVLNGLK